MQVRLTCTEDCLIHPTLVYAPYILVISGPWSAYALLHSSLDTLSSLPLIDALEDIPFFLSLGSNYASCQG